MENEGENQEQIQEESSGLLGGDQTAPSMDFIPEQFRNEGWATKYNTPDDFFKGVQHLNSMAGKKAEGLSLPGEEATDEDWTAHNQRMGMPETQDGYQLTEEYEKVEGLDYEDLTGKFKELAHSAGISNKQAEKLYAGYISQTNQDYKEEVEKFNLNGTEVVKELWGDDSDKMLNLAKRGAMSLGLGQELDSTNLSLNPAVLKMAAKIGELTAEGTLKDGGFSPPQSKEDLNAKMKELIGSENYYNDPIAQKEVKRLSQLIG